MEDASGMPMSSSLLKKKCATCVGCERKGGGILEGVRQVDCGKWGKYPTWDQTERCSCHAIMATNLSKGFFAFIFQGFFT
jgi:hypothetical protein